MMIQNHLLAGYLVSQTISNPVLGIPLAFFSHFLLDLFPHPTEEMEVKFQSLLVSKRDRATLAFMLSFGLLISILVVVLTIRRGLGVYALSCMISANLVDIWTQLLPIIKGTRLEIKKDHLSQPIKNTYVNIAIHQLFTLAGILYLLK